MMVSLTNLAAHVVQETPDEHFFLKEFLQFEDEKTAFYKAGGKVRRGKPKKVSLYKNGTFPAGLAAHVRKAAAERSMPFDWIDKRTPPSGCPKRLTDVDASLYEWLYPDQKEALRHCIRRTRGILKLPTGSGKTEIAVALARCVPCRWLFLAPEVDLMHNAARRFEKRTNEASGRIGEGIWKEERFTSATFQTLAAALKSKSSKTRAKAEALLGSVDGIIIDEVHTLPASSFYRVAMAAKNAYFRIGVSGTPLSRGDQKSLFAVAACGEIIHEVTPAELIKLGRISKPTIYMVEHAQAGMSKNYAGAYGSFVVESPTRNQVICAMAHRVPKPGLVFVNRLKHGRTIARQLRTEGLNVEFIWGDKNTAQRDDAIRRLRWGDLDLIVCSPVFQTGTDIPELEGLVIGCGGKSDIATIQRIGRGSRIVRDKDGKVVKDKFTVYDVLDRDARLEGMESSVKWLARHARRRRDAYLNEGYEVIQMSNIVAGKP